MAVHPPTPTGEAGAEGGACGGRCAAIRCVREGSHSRARPAQSQEIDKIRRVQRIYRRCLFQRLVYQLMHRMRRRIVQKAQQRVMNRIKNAVPEHKKAGIDDAHTAREAMESASRSRSRATSSASSALSTPSADAAAVSKRSSAVAALLGIPSTSSPAVWGQSPVVSPRGGLGGPDLPHRTRTDPALHAALGDQVPRSATQGMLHPPPPGARLPVLAATGGDEAKPQARKGKGRKRAKKGRTRRAHASPSYMNKGERYPLPPDHDRGRDRAAAKRPLRHARRGRQRKPPKRPDHDQPNASAPGPPLRAALARAASSGNGSLQQGNGKPPVLPKLRLDRANEEEEEEGHVGAGQPVTLSPCPAGSRGEVDRDHPPPQWGTGAPSPSLTAQQLAGALARAAPQTTPHWYQPRGSHPPRSPLTARDLAARLRRRRQAPAVQQGRFRGVGLSPRVEERDSKGRILWARLRR